MGEPLLLTYSSAVADNNKPALTVAHIASVKSAHSFHEIKERLEKGLTSLQKQIADEMEKQSGFTSILQKMEAEDKAIRRFINALDLIEDIKADPNYSKKMLKKNLKKNGNFDKLKEHLGQDIMLDRRFGGFLRTFLDERKKGVEQEAS